MFLTTPGWTIDHESMVRIKLKSAFCLSRLNFVAIKSVVRSSTQLCHMAGYVTKSRHGKGSGGFSVPEVMISSLLLTMVVINSASLYSRSQQSIQSSSIRDAAYSLINQDLEVLRNKAWKFACKGLKPNGEPEIDPSLADPNATSCTGLPRDASVPMSYKTTSTSPYVTSCKSGDLADLFIDDYDLPLKNESKTLDWKNLSAKPPTGSEKIIIKRIIKASGSQLDIAYAAESSSPLKILINSTLVPQAAAYCP